MHNPPYGGNLDISHSAGHIGSKAIRNKIKKEQPILTLHGHVHESPGRGNWIDEIGNTKCINPGKGENLQAVIINLYKDLNITQIRHTVYGKYPI